MRDWTPPDQANRDRIATDLETNLLVEAGAGSGKTTAMVGRMAELIRTGRAEVDEIAAVTFTRKAAAELRERFQEHLEKKYREALNQGDGEERERYSRALASLDRCFIGTIHSFCARLLRERPLEAGVAPNFEEVSGPDEVRLRTESWTRFLDRLAGRDSRLLKRLAAVGLRPAQLRGAFEELSNNPDVRFPAEPVPRPGPAEIAPVREALEALLADSLRLLPDQEPESGWDDLQRKVRRLDFTRRFPGWRRTVDFFDALNLAVTGSSKVTQYKWGDKEVRAAAKALGERWEAFTAEGGAARNLLNRWLAHRYRIALRFARAAAGHYAAERRRLGRLNFHDLLLRAAALLREHPDARRDLGRRFRWLLVDEFQDTDPVQAEVLFLLASDDEDARWTHVTPRPGALFVVGDPKQSIYRFRRADITVYNQVKARFAEFGAVLTLTANFRSRTPIETLVNRVFDGPFPAQATEHQAAFAPLAVKPGRAEQEGVFWYRIEPAQGKGGYTGARVSGPDGEALASWIRERIDRGERRPGDFMILTWTKSELSTYARALEARNIPVQVSGAGIGVEEELAELVLLLRALADPGDPVLTLAVLHGLFFGLSFEGLYAHAAAGGRFAFLGGAAKGIGGGGAADGGTGEVAAGAPGGPVNAALGVLREFWEWTRALPADVAVGRIVERLGVLPYAAAGELGATRAGALVYALDALRVAGLDGATSLPDAIEVLEQALEQEVDVSLAPGAEDVVRLMNLHKAKGLEAPVVVLAYPAASTEHAPGRRITRDAEGNAVGYVPIRDVTRRHGDVVARPLDWEAHAAAESLFLAAERERLLYVAATRAAEELVIARCDKTEDTSCWRMFHEALEDPAVATELVLAATPRPERETLDEPAAAILGRIEALRERRDRLACPTYRIAAVTARAKHGSVFGDAGGLEGGGEAGGLIERADRSEAVTDAAREAAHGARVESMDGVNRGANGAGRGADWGTAVHLAIEAAAQGVTGETLRAVCRAALIENERPVDARGEPTELEELVALVERLGRSAVWGRAQRADRRLVEAPFCIAFDPRDAETLGLAEERAGERTEVVEGVVDLAFREGDGAWVICDFKTDGASGHREERLALYRRQVDLYAACWERLTGEPVKERVLFFTHDGQEVVW
jgi:ATP-dependent helicase/nuclease subunit A